MGHVLEIDGPSWRTPLTGEPLRRVGNARLVRRRQRGYFHYEGTGGYRFYRARGWMPVTRLERRHGRSWRTWMVDDPLHWHGMRETVSDLPAGRILVAGLGLMLHHMAQEPRFTGITVCEIDADVVALIRPTMPEDARRAVVVDDFYRHIEAYGGDYDAVLWDLAVGTPAETLCDFIRARALCTAFMPGAPLVQFGIRRRKDTEVAACAQA
jgi:spermidine synthase